MKYSYLKFQLQEMHRLMLAYSAGNYKVTGKTSPLCDDMDSIIVGTNFLGEELMATTTSLDYFNSLYHAVSDMLFVLSPTGYIKDTNASVQKQLQYSIKKLSQKKFQQLICCENTPHFMASLLNFFNNTNHSFKTETKILSANRKCNNM